MQPVLRIVPSMHRSYRRLSILLALPATLMLAGCEMLASFASPPDAPPPMAKPAPAPTVEPAAAPRAPAPVPARKPAAPVVAPPPPPALPPVETSAPPRVVGLNRLALIQTYGLPVAEREAPPARIMEFGIGDCRLAAYLYFDTARNDFYTLQYEVNGQPAPSADADRCLTRISRDANRR